MKSIKELFILIRETIKNSEDGNIYYAVISLSMFNYITENDINTILRYMDIDESKSFIFVLFDFFKGKRKIYSFLKNASKEESIEWLDEQIDKL